MMKISIKRYISLLLSATMLCSAVYVSANDQEIMISDSTFHMSETSESDIDNLPSIDVEEISFADVNEDYNDFHPDKHKEISDKVKINLLANGNLKIPKEAIASDLVFSSEKDNIYLSKNDAYSLQSVQSEYENNVLSTSLAETTDSRSTFSSYQSYRMNTMNSRDSFSIQNQLAKINSFGDNIGTEYIDPMSGNLTVTETDLVLPGRDGFDLNLSRYYSLSQAEVYNKSATLVTTPVNITVEAGMYIVTEVVYDNMGNILNEYYYPCASSDLAILRKREIESRNTYGGLYEYEATVDEVDTETTIAVNYHYASELTSMNYHQTRSNLGIGWSWAFPSVQVIKNDYNNVNEEPKAIYYHDGHGRVLEVSVDGNNNCYFTNYIGEDISFEKCIHDDFANFSTKRIDYIVEDSDCTNYYFGPHGEIRSIIDIHGNKMEFEYTYTSFYGANSMPLISGITDSVGRYVDFEYTSNGMNEYIEVTVTSPFEAENELTLSYQKISENMYSEKISANSGNENSTYISNASFLQSVTYPNGDTTEYYPIQSEEDSNVVPTYFSFADKRLNSEFVYATGGYISNPVYLLGAIVRENSYTGYEYEVCTLNLGHSGVCTSFRVTERSDNLLVLAEITTDNNTTIYEASPGQIFNRVCYGYNDDISDYSHNYSGYPYYVDSEEISEDSNVCDTEVVYESSQHTYFYHKTDGAILNTKIYSEYFNPIGDDLTVVTKIESFYEKIPEITLITYSNESEYTYSSHKYANISSVHNKFFGKPWLVTDEMPVNSSEYIKYKQGISYEYDNYTGYILSKSWYQSDNVQCTENYTYTSDGRPMSFTAADGTGVTYAYEYTDGKVSKITETTLNDTGKTVIVKTYTAATNYAFPSIVQKSVTSNGSTSTETTSYTYDMLLGTVKTMTDNDGNTTFYEYDSVGRVTRIIYPVYFAYGSYSSKNTKILPIDVFTYANTVISHEMVNSADGELAVTLTEQITRYYDVTETDVSYPPSVDTSALSTTFSDIKREYHIGTGELVKSEWLDVTNNQYAINSNTYSFNTNTNTSTVTDSLGDTVTTYYDGMGREVKIKDKFDNFHITEYNRSGDGAGFNVLAYFSTDSTGANKENVKEYTYDRLGRILSEKAYSDYPNNFVESKYSYDLAGNVIGITDANGNLNKDGFTQTNAYDKLNRLISSKNANNEIVTNNYDNLGNIKNQSLTSKSGVTHTLYDRSYTGDGKILSDTDNSQNSNTYSYDSMGRLTEVTDKDLKTSSFSYNELGINDTQTHIKPDTVASMKREAVFNPYGADVVYNLSGTYDTENEAFALGLSEISQHIYSPTGNILYEESEYATSTGTTETFNPISEYIYDSEGKLTAQLHGVSGSETNTVRGAFTLYEYDKSRLLKVQINGSNVKNSSDNANVRYEYYDDGKLKTVIYPTLADGSVLKSEYEYDGLSRLTSLINYKDTQVLSSYFYTYDNNGNILTTTEIVGQTQNSTSYSYDNLNRITKVSGTKSADSYYEYDERGNRKVNAEQIDFLSEENASYSYDENDQLYYSQTGDNITNIKYSSDGYRYYKKENSTAPEFYVYDIQGRLQSVVRAVRASDGTNIYSMMYPTKIYIWDNSKVLAQIDKISNKTYYYLYNGHGDVVQIVDTSGNIVNQYDYDVWGNFITKEETIENHFTYFGQTYDETTGLYYLRARYYDSTTGRFTQQDPAEDGYNWYVYGNQNPVRFVDPTGCSSIVFVADGMEEQAKVRTKYYTEKYGTGSIMVSVDSASEFVYLWNTWISDLLEQKIPVEAIEIICHGSASGSVGFDEYGTSYATGYLIFDQGVVYAREIADMTKYDKTISMLKPTKAIELNISACNGANKDIYNVVYAMMGRVEAEHYSGFDGGAVWDETLGDHVRGGGEYGTTWRHPIDPTYYVNKYQATWWKYVPKKSDGSPTRNRIGRRYF